MPGHLVFAASPEATLASIAQLEQLITEHDVVFLLMDTREARWLPTLICAAQEKVTHE